MGWCALTVDDAVGEQERQRGSVVAGCEGISSDDGRGDRGEVVWGVEGLGRGAAESILGGVLPRGTLRGLGECLEE